MKKTWKQNVRYLLCVFIIGGMITGCTEDNDHDPIPESGLKSYSYHHYDQLNKSKRLEEQVTKVTSQNMDAHKSGTSDTYIIDTKTVQILEAEEYTNYTFRAIRFPIDLKMDHNYVLTLYHNGDFHQMYIDYPILEDGNYDISNATAMPIDGDALVQKSGCGSSGYPVTNWNEVCIDHNCGSGQHSGESQADSCNAHFKPFTLCFGGWVTTCIGSPGEQGQPANPSSGGGGGIGVTPFLPLGVDKGVDELMAQTALPEVKAMIKYLQTKVKDSRIEDGRMFNIDKNSDGTLQVVAEIDPVEVEQHYTKFPPIDKNTVVKIHMHQKHVYTEDDEIDTKKLSIPLFSTQDIASFVGFFNTKEALLDPNIRGGSDASDISSILVAEPAKFYKDGKPTGTETSGVYALKISDPKRVRELKDRFDTDIKLADLETEYLEKVVKGCGPDDTGCLLLNQLKFLENYDDGKGFGIQVYQAVEVDEEIKSWLPLNY